MRTGFHRLQAAAAVCAGLLIAAPASADDNVTLSGCLIRSTDNSGYLIVNRPSEPAKTAPADSRVSPDAFGGAGNFSTIFYWLENDDSMKPHVGHQVEIQGDLESPKDGELKVDRKDNWTEIELKSDGHTMHANVPHTSLLPAVDAKKDEKSKVIVRRVDVEKVKMLGASCSS